MCGSHSSVALPRGVATITLDAGSEGVTLPGIYEKSLPRALSPPARHVASAN
jgi:hypothetical protein